MLTAFQVLLRSLLIVSFLGHYIAHAAIENTVTVFATAPGGAPGALTATASETVDVVDAAPNLAVTKNGVLNDDDGTPGLSVGDTITYTVTVTNLGNISLTGVSITDPLVTLAFQGGDTDSDLKIDPTETWTYTGDYTITATDLSTGGGGDGDIDNIVTARSNETPDEFDSDEVLINPNISMVVDKIGVLNDDDGMPGLSAGDSIDYTITVENTGVADLTNISVTDMLVQGATTTPLTPILAGGDTNSDAIVNPGETFTYMIRYLLTQANIDNGSPLVNTASVLTDQVGPRTADDTQTLTGFTELYTMTKLASLNDGDGDNLGDVGETIDYTFRFLNTGNRTLTNLRVSDPLAGLSAITCAADIDADGDIDSLSPGSTADCSASYAVAVPDVLNGMVNNTATSSAFDTSGIVPVVEDDSANDNSTVTPTDTNVDFNVRKSIVSAVEILPNVVEIDYRIEFENIGSFGHTNITAQDNVVAAIDAPAELIGDATITSLSGFGGPGTANPAFNGSTDTELFSGDVQLAANATGEVNIKVLVDRKSQALGTSNTVIVDTDQLIGSVVSDDPNQTPGDPNDINPTVFNTPDQDNDGSPDANEDAVADRDGDGIPDQQDYDPTGYFYCEADGRILTGGRIAITNISTGLGNSSVGAANDIVILQDGSSGFYQFYVTQPGTYALTFPSLPASGVQSTSRLSSGTLDVTSLLPSNPGVLGSGEVGSTGSLADSSAASNPFYTVFVIEPGDPAVFNNNIPFALCGTPQLAVSKDVTSGPVLQADGTSNIEYSIEVQNTGNTRADSIELLDNLDGVFGATNFSVLSTALTAAPATFTATNNTGFNGSTDQSLLTASGSLEPGESVVVTMAINVDVVPASYTNTVVARGVHPTTAIALSDQTDTATVTIAGSGSNTSLIASKSTVLDQVRLGGTVPYTIRYENNGTTAVTNAEIVDFMPPGFSYVTGSARIDGTPIEPSIIGPRELIWLGRSIAAGGYTELTLQLAVGASTVGTEFVNYTYARSGIDDRLLSNRAQASVALEIESQFQCSHVIGRVFDDTNKDGYFDIGEPGLGGVRIASANGLLITTDQYGRYHVTCDQVPAEDIGSNYILKVDERTLPSGYQMTSENPRVVRLTRGKLSKLNFASARLRTVLVELTDASFRDGGNRLTQEALVNLGRMLPLLEEERSVLKINYRDSSVSSSLKSKRLRSVKSILQKAWKSEKRHFELEIQISAALR